MTRTNIVYSSADNVCRNISVVIQGPIDERTYEAIDCYQYFGEVIVSNWEGEDLSMLSKATGKYKLVQSKYNKNKRYHVQTTLAGAKVASLEYVMKTRSDELYPDLSAILDNLNKYPDRSHTTNNGFWKTSPYCYSNHLFVDNKDLVIKAMELALQSDKKFEGDENLFGYYLMYARGFELSTDNWKKIFKENVFITKCSDLKGHLHSGSTTIERGFSRSSAPYPDGRKETCSGKHDTNLIFHHIDEI